MDFIVSSGLSSAIIKPTFRKNKQKTNKQKLTATVVFPIIIDAEKWKETETSIRSKVSKVLKRSFIQMKFFSKLQYQKQVSI